MKLKRIYPTPILTMRCKSRDSYSEPDKLALLLPFSFSFPLFLPPSCSPPPLLLSFFLFSFLPPYFSLSLFLYVKYNDQQLSGPSRKEITRNGILAFILHLCQTVNLIHFYLQIPNRKKVWQS